MTYITGFCFLICGVIVLTGFKRSIDILSPTRVFIFIWAFAIGITDLKLSYFQETWSTYSWLVLLLGVISLPIGIFSVYLMYSREDLLKVSEIRQIFSGYAINQKRLFKSIVLIFIIYLISYISEILIEGYLPFFSSIPDKARIEWGVFGIHLFVNLFPTISFLIIVFYVLAKKTLLNTFLITTFFIILLVSYFFTLQRFNFFIWILMSLAFVYYTTNKLRFKHILIAGIVSLTILIFIQRVRLVAYVQNYIYVISKMKYSENYAFITEPYMYVVMNLENFTRGVSNLDRFTYGYFTADFFLALTGIKHWFADVFNIIERPFLISGYNTFSFLWPYYYDFGILGVVVFPYIIGVIIGFLYYSMRKNPNLINVSFYSIAFYVLVISFFTNPLTMLNTVFNLLLTGIIVISVDDKRGNHNE